MRFYETRKFAWKGVYGYLLSHRIAYALPMARKQTKKKIKPTGPPAKHRHGYRGRLGENAYVISREDVLIFENGVATLYREGIPLYRKEIKESELGRYIRLIGDYGDTVLTKHFQPIPEEESKSIEQEMGEEEPLGEL